jgi:hypothetical protein
LDDGLLVAEGFAVMSEKLKPCPFCEGPPCVTTMRVIGGGVFPDSEIEGDDGLFVKASVWCHECGADGPAIDDIAYSRADCYELERRAVALWNNRGNRHRSLYDSGEKRGLNEYPERVEVQS